MGSMLPYVAYMDPMGYNMSWDQTFILDQDLKIHCR